MNCKNCKHWQGTKYCNTYADCYRLIGSIMPSLLREERPRFDDEEVEVYTDRFQLPFDPHEIKYWAHIPSFVEKYKEAIKEARQTDGIRVVTKRREDIVYDQYNAERETKLTCTYLQTEPDFHCPLWKEKHD